MKVEPRRAIYMEEFSVGHFCSSVLVVHAGTAWLTARRRVVRRVAAVSETVNLDGDRCSCDAAGDCGFLSALKAN